MIRPGQCPHSHPLAPRRHRTVRCGPLPECDHPSACLQLMTPHSLHLPHARQALQRFRASKRTASWISSLAAPRSTLGPAAHLPPSHAPAPSAVVQPLPCILRRRRHLLTIDLPLPQALRRLLIRLQWSMCTQQRTCPAPTPPRLRRVKPPATLASPKHSLNISHSDTTRAPHPSTRMLPRCTRATHPQFPRCLRHPHPCDPAAPLSHHSNLSKTLLISKSWPPRPRLSNSTVSTNLPPWKKTRRRMRGRAATT